MGVNLARLGRSGLLTLFFLGYLRGGWIDGLSDMWEEDEGRKGFFSFGYTCRTRKHYWSQFRNNSVNSPFFRSLDCWFEVELWFIGLMYSLGF